MPNTFTYHSEVFFDELDGLGVLHHTRYLLHLERAQQKFFQELLGVDDFNAERDEDIYVVVHGLDARFREPLRVPGPLAVDYRIERVRSGGVTMAFTIRDPQGSAIYCDGTRTVCKLSSDTHRPTPWTEPFRAALDAYCN
ncbi:MAG: acyl-CoA thioesterase [Verrucomicrobia bacterium]|jgi:acyl-CoA thioester hydrolase|nr:acyl-CoA thioesterase [Verrucomicrobiota bacterium]